MTRNELWLKLADDFDLTLTEGELDDALEHVKNNSLDKIDFLFTCKFSYLNNIIYLLIEYVKKNKGELKND
ncbi:MAG: hypothetical protein KIT33_15330 [Candidatus Kapabacteria bacterium]|nr:hypothetical protein [Ignavibacteriota bacterium]MCW5886341.1 hypothetical protein [Candidatus Kapabacteria bacterium]